jgi:hypothetical protein
MQFLIATSQRFFNLRFFAVSQAEFLGIPTKNPLAEAAIARFRQSKPVCSTSTVSELHAMQTSELGALGFKCCRDERPHAQRSNSAPSAKSAKRYGACFPGSDEREKSVSGEW